MQEIKREDAFESIRVVLHLQAVVFQFEQLLLRLASEVAGLLAWYAIWAKKQEQPAGNYLTPQFHDSASCRNLAMESPSMMTELLPGYKHSQPPPPPAGLASRRRKGRKPRHRAVPAIPIAVPCPDSPQFAIRSGPQNDLTNILKLPYFNLHSLVRKAGVGA